MSRVELLQKLKVKRKEFADREGVELFMVFTNKTLEETVKAMPVTLQDLALVKGWGKTKIAKYGVDILTIIADEEIPKLSEVRLPHDIRKSDFRKLEDEDVVFSVAEFLEAVNI